MQNGTRLDAPGEPMAVTFTVKNVPEPLARALRRRAETNHRSLQGELLAILEAAAAPRGTVTLEEAWRFAREHLPETPTESVAMIREDRDAR